MGTQRQLSRQEGNQRRSTVAYKLSRELQMFYAGHYTSPWQKEYVVKVRRAYEVKEHELETAHYHGAIKIAKNFSGEEYDKKIREHNAMHDAATSGLSEKYMRHELDYLMATDEYKQKNPGMRWHPSGVRGLLAKAFWYNLAQRAKLLGANLSYGEKAIGK